MTKRRKSRKSKKGMYFPKNPNKYIGHLDKIKYRSSWELYFMKWLDNNKRVKRWNSEEVVINYFSKLEGKNRRYFVDFFVEFDDGKQIIVEIKPFKQTMPPVEPEKMTSKKLAQYNQEIYTYNVNMDKWVTAKDVAHKSGMSFVIVTEKTLKQLGMII